MDDHDGKFVFTTGNQKKAFILQHQDEFPERVKRTIREASLDKPDVFLQRVELSVANCCLHRLNDETDTQQAVELAIRCFPEFLGIKRSHLSYHEGGQGRRGRLRPIMLLPIRRIAGKSQSVSFVPLFAKIAIEMQIFEDYRRGGLVPEKEGPIFLKLDNVFWQLGGSEFDDNNDIKYLAVIRELRESNLMTKTDIRESRMIQNMKYRKNTEQRLRYLIDWDPSLLLPGQIGNRQLSWEYGSILDLRCERGDIHSITVLCELGLKYYPNELGFLVDPIYFVRDGKPISLYEFGCDVYGDGHMQGILNSFMCAQMKKDPSFTRKAVVRATSVVRAAAMGNKTKYCQGGLQSIFFLLQQDPTLLCDPHHRATPSEAQSTMP